MGGEAAYRQEGKDPEIHSHRNIHVPVMEMRMADGHTDVHHQQFCQREGDQEVTVSPHFMSRPFKQVVMKHVKPVLPPSRRLLGHMSQGNHSVENSVVTTLQASPHTSGQNAVHRLQLSIH